MTEHFVRHGDYFTDPQILESTRIWVPANTPAAGGSCYQHSFKRRKCDDQAINAMVERAEKVADGARPLRNDRLVKLGGTDRAANWTWSSGPAKSAG